jgi:hypothetical protein
MKKRTTQATVFLTKTPQRDGKQNAAQMKIDELTTAGDIWKLQRSTTSKVVALMDRA